MHPDAPLRRLLKSCAVPRIHQGLQDLSPERAAALLEDVSVEGGELSLGRTFASGRRARPWRTYAVLHLMLRAGDAAADLRAALTGVRLSWLDAESAPLDLTPLRALPALTHLVLRNAVGVHALPGLRLTTLRIQGSSRLSQQAAQATGASTLELSGIAVDPAALPADLSALTLTDCTGLGALVPPTKLRHLALINCPDLDGLTPPGTLESLVIRGCSGLTALELPAMPGLTLLEVPGIALSGSPGSPHLRQLRCGALQDSGALASPVLEQAELDHLCAAGLGELSGCTTLTTLHIEEAPALSDLSDLSGCTGLTSLRIRGGTYTTVAPLAGLSRLTTLSLQDASGLQRLDGLGGLPALLDLDLSGSALDSLDGLEGSRLTHLTLSRCISLDQIFALQDITTLQELLLPSGRGRWSARYVGDELAGLRERLRADHRRMEALSAGEPMAVRLRGLLMHEDVYHQRQALEVMRSFGPAFAAEVLGGCRFTEEGGVDIPFGEASESLLTAMLDAGLLPPGQRRLSIPADRLASLSFVERMPDLTHLHLTAAIHLTTLHGLQHATNLQELVLESCPVLADLSAIRGLRGLRRLVITDPNRAGTSFAPITAAMLSDSLRSLVWLEELRLDRCGAVPLTLLAGLSRLRILKAPALSPGQGFARISGLTALEDIEILDCRELEDLNALRSLPLRRLVLGSSDRLRDLRPLDGLTGLRELVIGGPKLSDLSPIASLTGLTVLGLSEASQVTDLSPLGALPALRELVLSGAGDVKDLRCLRRLVTLEELGLQDLRGLETLDGIAGLTRLRRLDLVRCTGLSCADALIDLGSLTHLKIEGYSELGSLLEPIRQPGMRQIWARRNGLYLDLQHRQRVIREALIAAIQADDSAAVEAELADVAALNSERLAAAVCADLQKQAGQDGPADPLPLRQRAITRLSSMFSGF